MFTLKPILQERKDTLKSLIPNPCQKIPNDTVFIPNKFLDSSIETFAMLNCIIIVKEIWKSNR